MDFLCRISEHFTDSHTKKKICILDLMNTCCAVKQEEEKEDEEVQEGKPPGVIY